MAKNKKTNPFKGKVSGNVQDRKNRGSSYGHLKLPQGIGVFKETPGGRASLDFIPYYVTDPKHLDRNEELEIALEGMLWYKKPYWLHRSIGPNGEDYVCPKTWGEPCPVCEWRSRRLKEGASYKDDDVSSAKASLRNLYVVIPRSDDKKHEQEFHIWDISDFNFQRRLNGELEEDEELEIFPSLEEGHTVRIKFSEEYYGKNPYAQAFRVDFKARKEPLDEKILNSVPNLDQVLIYHPYGELEKIFFGLSEEPEPEEGIQEDQPEPSPEDNTDTKPDPEPKKEKPTRTKSKVEYPEDRDELEDMSAKKLKQLAGELNCPADVDKIAVALGFDDDDEDQSPSHDGVNEKEDEENKCPHGYRFGVDTEEYEECDDCDYWEDCLDAKEDAGHA